MSKNWYLINDTRHLSGFESDEIAYGKFDFSRLLQESFEAYDVTVDDIVHRVILQSTTKYNERRILFSHGDINWGDMVVHDNENWLVTERPFFNKIHDKSKIQLCNANMKFEYETEGIIDYIDDLGNTVWLEKPQIVSKEFPCVVESISELNMKTTTGQQINVPEGDMVLLISYTTDELIRVGEKFEIFNEPFKITGVDRSKVKGSQGILTLIVSRTTN